MSERTASGRPSEIAAEHRLDADDWDSHWSGFAAASAHNPAVLYRARLVASLLEADGQPLRLLDIGVGSGDFLAFASRRWPEAELAGVDVSSAAIMIASRRLPGARLLVRDLTAEPEQPSGLERWATAAVCSEVLEHVDDPVALLRNGRKLLAPGCKLVVTVPSGRMSSFDRHIGHRRHYTPDRLRAQLEAGGFSVEQVDRAGFPFFNVYRALVRARGERLVEDARREAERPSAPARVATVAFRTLFSLNLSRSPWGLQIVAVANRR